jgi:hypothetical protein
MAYCLVKHRDNFAFSCGGSIFLELLVSSDRTARCYNPQDQDLNTDLSKETLNITPSFSGRYTKFHTHAKQGHLRFNQPVTTVRKKLKRIMILSLEVKAVSIISVYYHFVPLSPQSKTCLKQKCGDILLSRRDRFSRFQITHSSQNL